MTEIASQPASVSLGKGAWDCDLNVAIPPEKEAAVFEEIATVDFPFEGIPTIPPRKDMDHMTFFCGGCRYRVTAYPDWTAAQNTLPSVEDAAQVKMALWAGGIQRANKPPEKSSTPGMTGWQDMTLIYAGHVMEDDKQLREYSVPMGCQVCIAIETAKLYAEPDPDSAYWN